MGNLFGFVSFLHCTVFSLRLLLHSNLFEQSDRERLMLRPLPAPRYFIVIVIIAFNHFYERRARAPFNRPTSRLGRQVKEKNRWRSDCPGSVKPQKRSSLNDDGSFRYVQRAIPN